MEKEHAGAGLGNHAPRTTETGFRFHHLKQLFWSLEAAIVAVLLLRLGQGRVGLVEAMLAVTALSMCLVPWMVRRELADLARVIMLSMIAVMLSVFMWLFKGLRDEVVLAFPVLLVFTALMGHRRLFFVLLAYSSLTVIGIGLVNHWGWWSNDPASTGLTAMVIILVILLVSAYIAWVIARDLRHIFASLQAENRRALESQARIERLVFHDALTGLPNRSLAREFFNHALALARRQGKMVATLFVDLDHFKSVNDSYGHQAGDDMLVKVAVRLEAALRDSDQVCRQGGDEFLVILEDIQSQEQAAAIALKLLDAIRQPTTLADANVVLTASIGIAMSPADGEDFEVVSKLADIAMYDVKEKGRNGYRFFNSAMNTDATRDLNMLTELREAVPKQQLELHFQPRLSLHSGEVVGAEALVRWQHPTAGLLDPGRFIQLAERSGVIVDITEWVIPAACQACAEWHSAGYPQLSVSVNVSPMDFKRGHIVELVQSSLAHSGLAPGLLELELTETMLIEYGGQVSEAIDRLSEMGVSLAIDDFGTGYSSLQYLKRHRTNVLKVDRSFISRVDTDTGDEALVQAMLGIARSFDLTTVAEGVDSQAVANKVADLGCDMGQGFYWARAMEGDEFLRYVASMHQQVRAESL